MSGTLLESSGEELGESLVVAEVRLLDLLHVDAVHLGEAAVHQVSKGLGQPQGAHEAGQAGDNTGDGDNVLEVPVFLECFVEGVDGVQPGEHLAEERDG